MQHLEDSHVEAVQESIHDTSAAVVVIVHTNSLQAVEHHISRLEFGTVQTDDPWLRVNTRLATREHPTRSPREVPACRPGG